MEAKSSFSFFHVFAKSRSNYVLVQLCRTYVLWAILHSSEEMLDIVFWELGESEMFALLALFGAVVRFGAVRCGAVRRGAVRFWCHDAVLVLRLGNVRRVGRCADDFPQPPGVGRSL